MQVACSKFSNKPRTNSTKHSSWSNFLLQSQNPIPIKTPRSLQDLESLYFDQINYIPLDSPRLFPFFNTLMNTLKHNYSDILLYPYSIQHSNGTTSNGGLFDINKKLNANQLPNWPLTDIQYSKAKPLYLNNIGILSKKIVIEEYERNLFSEESDYCVYFTSMLFLYPKCLRYQAEYEEELAKGNKGPFIIFLNEESLVNILVNKDGTNVIDLLFIPDYYPMHLDEAKAFFTPEVMNAINKFLENKGTIIVSGKSPVLLETMGYIAPNTYNLTYVVRGANSKKDFNVTVTKCIGDVQYTQPNGSLASFNEAEDLLYKTVLCNGLETNGIITSTYTMNKGHSNDFETLISVERFKEQLVYINQSNSFEMPIEPDAEEIPYLMTKQINQGRLFVFNGNPLFRVYQDKLFHNILLYSSMKDANLIAKLILTDSNPIPSGENNVELKVDLNFTNHSPNDLTVDIHVFLPKYYMMYMDYDKVACVPTDTAIFKGDYDIEKNNLNASTHLLCHYDTVTPNQLIYLIFKIGFSSIATNEFVTNINIMQPMAYYINKVRPLNKQFIVPPMLKAKTAKAAMLKGTVDCGGATFYPLPGRGKEQKTTIKVQNKYATEAKAIEYIDVIPLITPIIDSNNYSSMGRAMSFMSEYYKQKGFKVPFTTIGDSDYLDILYLNNRNVRLVPEYDQVVRVEKETRTTDKYGPVDIANGDKTKVSIGNINYSTLIDDPNTIIKQIFIGKSSADKEKTQRLMCFIDDISQDAQKEILFARIDISFNNSFGYMPTGISSNHVISIEKDLAKEVKWGSFNQDGLIPTQFINKLLDNEQSIVVNGTNSEEIRKVTHDITPTHYLIPVISKDIASIEQLKDFTADTVLNDGSGYHNYYPTIKFIKAHSMAFAFKVKNANSQGGKLIVHLPTDITFTDSIDPVKEAKISFASDKIAFTKTIYDPLTNTIEAFFKSGLLTLENSNIIINIESLSLHQSFSAKVETFEMKYDLSVKENNHEVYVNVFNYDLEAVYTNFFSLPAIEMRIKTNKMLGSQIKSPYTEYSLYIQELYHRTVYGSMKSNHVTEPGAQLMASGFSLITKIGATSEHLINFISGKSTAIPSSSSSSRIEWIDLWNRNWAQPLSTLFSESPSDGISKYNGKFTVATTYELTKDNGRTRVLQWRPEEEVELRVKIKLSNLYNKYFEPTICNKIQIPFKSGEYYSNTVYEDAPNDLEYTMTDDKTHLTLGHSVDYGKCYMNPLAIMSGKTITTNDYTELSTVKLCSPYTDIPSFEKCIEDMESRLKVSSNGVNYSPDVEDYYPKGYITSDMWNMKINGYENHTVFKGYKYHHDNNLPNADLDIDAPQNIIGFSILKPLDYLISYDKSLSLSTYPNYKGWWSDNLQNRDDTLLAGQSDSYKISQEQSNPLTEDKWLHYSQLNSLTANDKSKNEYMCLFNQHRIKTIAKQSKYAHSSNVLQNNVIPIIKTPNANMNCQDIPQYTEQNISQYDNKLVTQSDVDWLYFASNIRAQAKESINIVLKLKGLNYIEGIYKVLDGIEFNYWNPLSEPNTFTKLKSDPTLLEAVDGGIEVQLDTWPRYCDYAPVCLFNYLVTIVDKGERYREYQLDSYYNSYGFGDVSTGVVVGGGINGSGCKLYPGNVTYIDITITNNAGYDFNIIKGGYEYANWEQGSDILYNDASYIINPTKINVIAFDIPVELQEHIIIEPSNHLSQMPIEEISFNHYNPTSIKDGTKAHFFFKLTIKDTYPLSEMSMMKSIPVSLNINYFDHIIGNNDLLPSLHNYLITIPPIKFGVPQTAVQTYAGKIYDINAYNSGLYYQFVTHNYGMEINFFTLNETLIETIRLATSNLKYDRYNFLTLVNNMKLAAPPLHRIMCPFTYAMPNVERFYRLYHCNLGPIANKFPVKQSNGLPDATKIFLWFGYSSLEKVSEFTAIEPKKFTYYDSLGRNRTASLPSKITYKVSGPFSRVKANYTLLTQIKDGQIFEVRDGLLYSTDSGVMLIKMIIENIGDAYAYNMNFTIFFGELITFNKTPINPIVDMTVFYETNRTRLLGITNKVIPMGEQFYLDLYLNFTPYVKPARMLSAITDNDIDASSSSSSLPLETETHRVIIDRIDMELEFQHIPEKPKGNFTVDTRLLIPYPDEGKSKRREIFVNITNVGTFENPRMNIKPETRYFKYEEEDYSFELYRRIISTEIGEEQSQWKKISEKESNDTFEDTPIVNATANYVIEYRVEAYITQTQKYAASGVNSHSINKIINEDVIEKDKSLGLILVVTLSSVVLLIIIIVLSCVFYRIAKRRREDKDKIHKVVGTVPIETIENNEKVVPIETLNIRKFSVSNNNHNDTDSDMSPTKFRRDSQPDFSQPNFIRIKRRISTHGTTSTQNYINEQ